MSVAISRTRRINDDGFGVTKASSDVSKSRIDTISRFESCAYGLSGDDDGGEEFRTP